MANTKKTESCYKVSMIAMTCVILVLSVTVICLGVWIHYMRIHTDNEELFKPLRKVQFGAYRYAAVTSEAEPCATIGVDILTIEQGSAVDAAIATMLCMGVLNFNSAGIGGGHFMNIYERPNNGSSKVLNTILAQERAPLAATEEMFVNSGFSSVEGGRAIAVPGEIKGFHQAWLKFGRVPWSVLFQPAIKLSRNGFRVSNDLHMAVRGYEGFLNFGEGASELFKTNWSFLKREDGSPISEGDIIKRPTFAKTLEIISRDPDAFYNPESQLAKDIVADIQEQNGIITLEDLASYRVYDEDPIAMKLRNGDFTVYVPRPPSGGVVYQYILNILDGYNFTAEDMSTHQNQVQTFHRFTEALKFAYAKRSELGDEAFRKDLSKLLQDMTAAEYGDHIRSLINDTHTQPVSFYKPKHDVLTDSGTQHTSILTADGAAVSFTGSLNTVFGSKVLGSRTGIIFNNQMDDFSTPNMTNFFHLEPSPANFIKPSRMPMSSMCPVIILDADGDVRLVTGGIGGTHIMSVVAWVTMLTLWMGRNVSDATELNRIHHQLLPNKVWMEEDFNQDLKTSLESKGHEFQNVYYGFAHSVHNTCKERSTQYFKGHNECCIHAVTDARPDGRRGRPDGY